MKNIDVAYLSKKINKLNKKINRAKKQGNENKVWWRKIKFDKLTNRLKSLNHPKSMQNLRVNSPRKFWASPFDNLLGFQFLVAPF